MGEGMKKTFSFEATNHKPARVIETTKRDLRKYVARERRKKLPEGVDFWDFDCRIGKDSVTAQSVHLSALHAEVDRVFESGASEVYVEILAKPGRRNQRPKHD